MGFLARPKRNDQTSFYLIEETWNSSSKKAIQKTVKTAAYPALGFRYDMTLEEAKARASQINQQSQIESRKIAATVKRVEDAKLIDRAYLPAHLCVSFEVELRQNYEDNPERLDHILQHWRAAQLIISALALDPKDFHTERAKFFNYYRDKKWSPNYIKKLNSILNQWGNHCAKKNNAFYQILPKLSASQIERLVDVRDDLEGRKTTAETLSWDALRNKRSTFANEDLTTRWNWMYISLFFGLRPNETDSLHKSKHWRIERDEDKNIDVLMVYQTKLTSIAKDKRWKPIPVYFKEQIEALALIKSGEFKRPLNKTLQRLLEGQIETYSPRKGFTDLMLERGFDLEDISIFLGHQNINMTWRRYKDKKKFKLPKAS